MLRLFRRVIGPFLGGAKGGAAIRVASQAGGGYAVNLAGPASGKAELARAALGVQGGVVLLSPGTTECAVPQGIFASPGGEAGGAMLRMIAYGPESTLSHPARPANAPKSWQPEWTVRVRTKSQTMAMLGMDMGGMAGGSESNSDSAPAEAPEEKPSGLPGAAGSILRGIFGR